MPERENARANAWRRSAGHAAVPSCAAHALRTFARAAGAGVLRELEVRAQATDLVVQLRFGVLGGLQLRAGLLQLIFARRVELQQLLLLRLQRCVRRRSQTEKYTKPTRQTKIAWTCPPSAIAVVPLICRL